MENGHKPNLTWQLDPVHNPTLSYFREQMLARKLGFHRQAEWPSDTHDLELDRVIARSDISYRSEIVGWLGEVLVYAWIGLNSGSCSVSLAGLSLAAVAKAEEEIRARLPVRETGEAQVVPITFWHHTSQGPQTTRRVLEVPRWQEIQLNYAAQTGQRLSSMYGLREPRGGKLFVWHGPAGGGKTFAVRSLAWEWRKWVDFHYLIDPETFFGNAPADLMQVALQGESDTPSTPGQAQRWKLLILEDVGELLQIDAKQHVGQALSRLLNLVDGLIGQGLHLMVLITTNDEMAKLHPAVTRAGRCAMDVYFDDLSVAEANRFLAQANPEIEPVTEPTTLANLYALLNDWQGQAKRAPRRLGFLAGQRSG